MKSDFFLYLKTKKPLFSMGKNKNRNQACSLSFVCQNKKQITNVRAKRSQNYFVLKQYQNAATQ